MMSENKSEDAIEAAVDDKPEAEQVQPAEEAAPNESSEPVEAEDAPRKKSHLGLWLFLFFILIALPAAWFYSPAPLRDQALHWLNQIVPSTQRQTPPETPEGTATSPATTPSGESTAEGASPSASATPPSSAPVSSPSPASPPEPATASAPPPTPPSESAPAPSVAPTPPPAVKPAAKAAAGPAAQTPMTTPGASKPAAASSAPTSSSPAASLALKQVASLVDQIKQLQEEVASMQAGQAELRQQLQARQRMELRNKLRWLSRPEASLAQQAAIWGDIATLPGLDEAQRGTAEAMAKLAQDDVMHVADWREQLASLADKLPEVRQVDILPKSKNKYLSWLIDAFHLHHAPSELEQQSADLRRRALAMAQALASEDWPKVRDWRDLLAALHQQYGGATNLGLPESLDVQQHLASMRQHAAAWLESL